jgi:hypothetical protein
MRWGFLIIYCALCLRCTVNTEEISQKEIWHSPGSSFLLLQAGADEVSAVDIQTGKQAWDYKLPDRREKPYGIDPPSSLSCPPILLPNGNLIFRYVGSIHALVPQNPEPLWLLPTVAYWFCPAGTPDSGIVLITQFGSHLEKINSLGAREWLLDFGQEGIAKASPTVVFPSGDIIVRTHVRLLSISPAGKINWNVPLEILAK